MITTIIVTGEKNGNELEDPIRKHKPFPYMRITSVAEGEDGFYIYEEYVDLGAEDLAAVINDWLSWISDNFLELKIKISRK